MIADPLYKWAMSPIKAKQWQQERTLQGGGGGADGEAEELLGDTSALPAAAAGGNNAAAVAADAIGNADAERAVLRVRQKLEGVEVRAEHCEWRSSLAGQLRATVTSPRGRQDRHSPPDCLPLFSVPSPACRLSTPLLTPGGRGRTAQCGGPGGAAAVRCARPGPALQDVLRLGSLGVGRGGTRAAWVNGGGAGSETQELEVPRVWPG